MVDKTEIIHYIHVSFYIIATPFAYFFLICVFYTLFKVLIPYIYTKFFFLKWAKEQRIVSVTGGPGSGKKLFLSFLGEKFKKEDNEVVNFITFFETNKAYDIEKKKWNKFSEIFHSNDKKRFFLISEMEDFNFWKNKISSSEKQMKKKIILRIFNGNYFDNHFWISFTTKNGFLWNKICSRSSVSIECVSTKTQSILWFKIYFFNIIIRENSVKVKSKTIISIKRNELLINGFLTDQNFLT